MPLLIPSHALGLLQSKRFQLTVATTARISTKVASTVSARAWDEANVTAEQHSN
jgi:hypothetical protein